MPHKRTTAELQEHGQILYRRKEYAKALELFSEAITSEPNLTVSLLDNRAATYEKLEDITSALKDAKSAIRLYEKDPTGYLRAGKLLQKVDKPEVALGIYKHGIKKKVKNVELLVKLHDKLLRSTAPPTAADPFAQLPIELVEMILAHLSFRQIVSCTRVSKQWNTFISSLPNLWTELDLSEARKPVKNSFISLCLNRSDRKIEAAQLKFLSGSEKAISALVHRCKDLRSMTIIDGGVLSYDFVNLLSSARNLTKLKLGAQAPMGLDAVTQLLREISTLTHVEVLAVVAKSRAVWAGELPGLQTLTLASNTVNTDFPVLNLGSLVQRTPNLLSLRLSGFVGGFLGVDLKLYCPNLQTFDFSNCDSVRNLLPSSGLPPSLRTFRANKSLTCAIGSMISTPVQFFLPHLEELELGDCNLASVLLSNPAMMDLAATGYNVLLPEDHARWASDPSILELLRTPASELSKIRIFKVDVRGTGDQLSSLLSFHRLSALQHLQLTGSFSVNDDIAEVIALNFADLRYLNLSSTAVTGYGVRKIVETCKKLEHMMLIACERCSGDAVEWSRSKGIKVDYSMNAEVSKAKKLRYGY